MKLSRDDVGKLLYFVLTDESIKISNKSVYTRSIIRMLYKIYIGKAPNNFDLNDDQKRICIEAFLKGKLTLDSDTPSFICKDEKCIMSSAIIDIDSIKYINDECKLSEENQKIIINKAKEEGYWLEEDSPLFLKRDFEFAKYSINETLYSVEYIDWEYFKNETSYYDELIDYIISHGYYISRATCEELCTNRKLALYSVKQYVASYNYIDESLRDDPEIFNYYASRNGVNKQEIEDRNIALFEDKTAMRHALKAFGKIEKDRYALHGLSEDEYEKYADRVAELYSSSIKKRPTIATFERIFDYYTEIEWGNYKRENSKYLCNVFGKICAELQDDSFNYAVNESLYHLLRKIENKLGKDRYAILLQSMEEYYNLIHNYNSDNQTKIELVRDKIAKLCALYVAKSKEDYKAELNERYMDEISDYFSVDAENAIIKKKIREFVQKQVFKRRFNNLDKDPELSEFIYNLSDEMSNEEISDYTVNHMIRNFICNGYSKLDSFMCKPFDYDDYIRYKEALKLINRLNSKFIKYTDLEVISYLDIIKYDNQTGKYYYDGYEFDEDEIKDINGYVQLLKVFDKIKREITKRIKAQEITADDLKEYADSLNIEVDFSDQFLKFDSKYLKFYNFERAIFDSSEILEPSVILDDEQYETIKKYVGDTGLLWFLILTYGKTDFEDCIDKDQFRNTIDEMDKVLAMAKSFNYSLEDFKDFEMVRLLSTTSTDLDIAILGKDLILNLIQDQQFTDEDSEEIIRVASELVSKKQYRNEFTVPVVSGETDSYCYSTYDSLDDSLLLSGSYTDSCFRVCGNDNDFLHYCALDKNGIVLKITDKKGNFIARAAGFRNGNAVYFNQLRTIYDITGNNYSNDQQSETAQIIDAFEKACKDIVRISQENPNEKQKINYVFVTRSYSMATRNRNISDGVKDFIGDTPMDIKSDDWESFVNNNENLDDCGSYGFGTDYGSYHLICMASIKDSWDIRREDIKQGDVPALYTRKRNQVVATDKITPELINRVNKVKGCAAKVAGIDYEKVEIPEGSIVFYGDNWYLIYNDYKVIDSESAFDSYAEKECNAIASLLFSGMLEDNNTPVNILLDNYFKKLKEEAEAAKKEIKIKRLINRKNDKKPTN